MCPWFTFILIRTQCIPNRGSSSMVSLTWLVTDLTRQNYKRIKGLKLFFPLLASTGGLLGLCLGFSVLSLLEIIYFITIRAWFNIAYKKRALLRFQQKCKNICKKLRGHSQSEPIGILPFTNPEFEAGWRRGHTVVQVESGIGNVLVNEIGPALSSVNAFHEIGTEANNMLSPTNSRNFIT